MSIGSIGGAGSGLSQLMASLLSRIKQNEDASSTTAASSTSSTSTSNQTSSTDAVTGSSEPTLSDQVIGALVMMQMNAGNQTTSTDSSAQNGADQNGSDPISQAFFSLDTDGDGTISQSELETAIENAGGTADEADAVYSALGGTSSSGISESTFTQAAQTGAPPPPPDGGMDGASGAQGHHHHHAGDTSETASDEAQQIFSSLQTNQDGTVSDDTLASALGLNTSAGTSTSGSTSSDSTTSSSASSILSQIDANGDGSVSQSELANYLETLQQQSPSDQTTLSAFMKLANQSYNSTLGLLNTSSSQGTTA